MSDDVVHRTMSRVFNVLSRLQVEARPIDQYVIRVAPPLWAELRRASVSRVTFEYMAYPDCKAMLGGIPIEPDKHLKDQEIRVVHEMEA